MKTWDEIRAIKRIAWQQVGDDGMQGIIKLNKWEGSIIFSTGAGWEHVSVAPFKRRIVPSWEDMCLIKNLFWSEDEAVIEVHPAKADYVNNLANCLHLWRCSYKEMVLPPRILVGAIMGLSLEQMNNELKEAYKLAGEELRRNANIM